MRKAENLNFQIEKTTGVVQNLYSVNFVALGDTYADLGDKQKAKSCYQKAVETWRKLQTAGRLYTNQTKNLITAEQKLAG